MSDMESTYEQIDLAQAGPLGRYKLLTGSVIPRPIAWVTTRSASGVVNAAPFSQFMIASYEPALLAISIGPGPRGQKDTLANIEAGGEFVINTVPEHVAELVQESAKDFPADVSEADLLGLRVLPSVRVAVPRLAISAIQFECRRESVFEAGESRIVLGRVVMMHVQSQWVVDQKISVEAHRTLARLGGRNYLRFGEVITV